MSTRRFAHELLPSRATPTSLKPSQMDTSNAWKQTHTVSCTQPAPRLRSSTSTPAHIIQKPPTYITNVPATGCSSLAGSAVLGPLGCGLRGAFLSALSHCRHRSDRSDALSSPRSRSMVCNGVQAEAEYHCRMFWMFEIQRIMCEHAARFAGARCLLCKCVDGRNADDVDACCKARCVVDVHMQEHAAVVLEHAGSTMISGPA